MSNSTVSHVIKTTRFVEEATRSRVLEVITESGYQDGLREIEDIFHQTILAGIRTPMFETDRENALDRANIWLNQRLF